MRKDNFGLCSNKPVRQSPGVLESGRIWEVDHIMITTIFTIKHRDQICLPPWPLGVHDKVHVVLKDGRFLRTALTNTQEGLSEVLCYDGNREPEYVVQNLQQAFLQGKPDSIRSRDQPQRREEPPHPRVAVATLQITFQMSWPSTIKPPPG